MTVHLCINYLFFNSVCIVEKYFYKRKHLLSQALNEMGEQQHLPLEFVDGFIMEISLSIPWSALLSQASYVEVKGLRLTVQPRQRIETGTSMFESMWSSMTSSMQLAQECLQQDAANAGNAQPLEAVELFAQTIDSSMILDLHCTFKSKASFFIIHISLSFI